MKTLAFSLLALTLSSSSAYALDCKTAETLCSTECSVKHFSDDAAKAGCQLRCTTEQVTCFAKQQIGSIDPNEVTEQAKQEALELLEHSQDAIDQAKSFIEGFKDSE